MSDPLLDALRKSLEQDPGNGELWMHYGEVCERSHHLNNALVAYRTVLKLEPESRSALGRLLPLLRRGGLAEALIRADAYLEKHEDPEIREELERIEVARARARQAKD